MYLFFLVKAKKMSFFNHVLLALPEKDALQVLVPTTCEQLRRLLFLSMNYHPDVSDFVRLLRKYGILQYLFRYIIIETDILNLNCIYSLIIIVFRFCLAFFN